jgi:hypothetical protein
MKGRSVRSLVLAPAILALAIGGAAPAWAQAAATPSAAPPTAVAPSPRPAVPAGPAAPARAFRGVELGMDRDAVIGALKKDSIFAYRGPEDISLLPSPNQSLIEVTGPSFVRRAFFQFLEGKLWTIIVELDRDKLDHYAVYTSLVAKYGEPALLDPKEARWEDKETRMALERPLTLRYMDMKAYGKLREGNSAKASERELDRQGFLGGL